MAKILYVSYHDALVPEDGEPKGVVIPRLEQMGHEVVFKKVVAPEEAAEAKALLENPTQKFDAVVLTNLAALLSDRQAGITGGKNPLAFVHEINALGKPVIVYDHVSDTSPHFATELERMPGVTVLNDFFCDAGTFTSAVKDALQPVRADSKGVA